MNKSNELHKDDRLYKLSKGTYTARWAHDEIVNQDNKIAELQAENERLKQELEIHNLEQQAKGIEDIRKFNVQQHRKYGSDWLKGNVIASMQDREKQLRNQAKEQGE